MGLNLKEQCFKNGLLLSERSQPRLARKWGHLDSIKSTSLLATGCLEQLENFHSCKTVPAYI